jgi:outer membrane protein OmpA-like peptidoglycan-associated protein
VFLLTYFVLRGRPPQQVQRPSDQEQRMEKLAGSSGVDTLRRYLTSGDTKPERFLLEAFEFKTGSSAVTSNETLDQIATELAAHPPAQVRVEAGSDGSGDMAADQALAQSRADNLKSYLIQHGVAADRIEAQVASPSGATNRKIQLVVTNAKAQPPAS